MLKVRDLHKRYRVGRRWRTALHGVSLHCREGEIHGLLGANGAGKTTLIRIVAGLLPADAGEIRLSCSADRPEARKRQLGHLSPATRLYDDMRVAECLEYFGALYGLSRRLVRSRIAGLARSFSFGHLLRARIDSLSTGEYQRVNLARAMIHEPRLLLLDEPSLGLDPLASTGLTDAMRLHRSRGGAVLLCTHDLDLAARHCDRVTLLHEGRVLTSGDPASIAAGLDCADLHAAFLLLVRGRPA